MKKMVGLLVMLGVGLVIMTGCGQTKASEKTLTKSDDVFVNGVVYKIGESDEKTSYFEITQKENNLLTVYDLENSHKAYEVPYETEKMESGYLLYKFDGPKINDYSLFYNGAYGETENYYLVNIDDIYYFVPEGFVVKQGGDLNNNETIKLIKQIIDKYGLTSMTKIEN